jgi:hypothetical protein
MRRQTVPASDPDIPSSAMAAPLRFSGRLCVRRFNNGLIGGIIQNK